MKQHQSGLKKVVSEIRKEAMRQLRGWPDDFRNQLTRGWGEQLARQIFGGPRHRRHGRGGDRDERAKRANRERVWRSAAPIPRTREGAVFSGISNRVLTRSRNPPPCAHGPAAIDGARQRRRASWRTNPRWKPGTGSRCARTRSPRGSFVSVRCACTMTSKRSPGTGSQNPGGRRHASQPASHRR